MTWRSPGLTKHRRGCTPRVRELPRRGWASSGPNPVTSIFTSTEPCFPRRRTRTGGDPSRSPLNSLPLAADQTTPSVAGSCERISIRRGKSSLKAVERGQRPIADPANVITDSFTVSQRDLVGDTGGHRGLTKYGWVCTTPGRELLRQGWVRSGLSVATSILRAVRGVFRPSN